MSCEYLKWLLTSEVLCHSTGRSNCTWDRELWQYWLLQTTNTCIYIFHDRARAMLAAVARQWVPQFTTKGIYLLVLLVLNSCPTPGESQWCNILLPGCWQCKKRTYPKTWLISCSAPVLIGSMLLKAVSLHPCSLPQAFMSSDWRVVFGLVLCLSSTSIALSGSCAATAGAAPGSPPGALL